MVDYLKYYAGVLVLAVGYVGFVLGGPWMSLGILTFPVLAVLDALLPNDMSARRMSSAFWARVPVWICSVGPVGLHVAFAIAIARGGYTGWELLGGVLSCGWLGTVPLVPAAHELYHSRNRFSRTVGHYCHLCILDCTRDIGHVVGHHIDVATVSDGDTAPRGMSMYAFVAHAFKESTLYMLKVEGDALQKKGFGRWNWRHRLYRAIFAQALFQTGIFLVGGWIAVGCSLAAMCIGKTLAEVFNYFQHYGLVRDVGAPIGRRHVWNHLGWFTRTVAFEITNHADHHQNSYLPYYVLVPHREWIPMPSVFMCFFASLVPPLFQNVIMKPALKRWDLEFATPREREMAREQNRRAGWPDWLGDERERDGQPIGAAATVGI